MFDKCYLFIYLVLVENSRFLASNITTWSLGISQTPTSLLPQTTTKNSQSIDL